MRIEIVSESFFELAVALVARIGDAARGHARFG
jgi:hypothetical protein